MIKLYKFKDNAEWLEARKKYIGGSECSAILGLNPYISNTDLWEIKTGKKQHDDISESPFVKYGHAAEPCLRDLFNLDFPMYEIKHNENSFYVNDKYPFAHASLDGLLYDQYGRTGILEIKTTEISSGVQAAKWKNRIPDNYYCQILHYMAVMDAEFTVVKAQFKYIIDGNITTKCNHYFYELQECKEDIEMLMESEREFYSCIKENRKPSLMLPEI